MREGKMPGDQHGYVVSYVFIIQASLAGL